jgi:H+-transporting ATPase
MVTGDQLAIAIETSRRLGLGVNIMEGKELMGDKEVGQGLASRVSNRLSIEHEC